MWAFALPLWAYVHVGFCPMGFCPRGFCPMGLCPTLRVSTLTLNPLEDFHPSDPLNFAPQPLTPGDATVTI